MPHVYINAPPLGTPEVLPIPAHCTDLEQAKSDLTEFGLCIVKDVLTGTEVDQLSAKLDHQAAAERALGELAPLGTVAAKQSVSNMVNKGKMFLDLVERNETDELAGYLLGKDFLISSINGGVFGRPSQRTASVAPGSGTVAHERRLPCRL